MNIIPPNEDNYAKIEIPDVVGSLQVFRAFGTTQLKGSHFKHIAMKHSVIVDGEEIIHDDMLKIVSDYQLRGVAKTTPFLQGWNRFTCMRPISLNELKHNKNVEEKYHSKPVRDCKCGYWGVYDLPDIQKAIKVDVGCVLGVIEVAGKLCMGDFGVRAERARLVALLDSNPEIEDFKVRTLLKMVFDDEWQKSRYYDKVKMKKAQENARKEIDHLKDKLWSLQMRYHVPIVPWDEWQEWKNFNPEDFIGREEDQATKD